MNVRRIVTGRDPSGNSVFVSDGVPPIAHKFEHVPGMEAALVWETKLSDRLPCHGSDPTNACTPWVPEPGGTKLLVITFPPRGQPVVNSQQAGAEALKFMPVLAEKFERDAPGMHTTDTFDYAVLLSGEVELELDNGEVRKLAPHDIVVQNGTRHAWRNKFDLPATMLFVLTGAAKSD